MSNEENVKISIRIPQDLKNKLSLLSDQNSCTISELIRASLNNDFEKHINSIEYIDVEQGKRILDILFNMYTEISQIKLELNRLGVNYNQAVRMKHIENNYRNHLISHREFLHEIESIHIECDDFSTESLDRLMKRYESCTNKLVEGLKLCRSHE